MEAEKKYRYLSECMSNTDVTRSVKVKKECQFI